MKHPSEINILIACEESQAVCIAFRERGFNAFSCDILPCSGGHPEWHIKGDILKIFDGSFQAFNQFWTEAETVEPSINWDLIIAFPPCTYLTVTGNRWFNESVYGEKGIKRKKDRLFAINFFMLFANNKCKKIAIENPVGIMSSEWRKPDQIINPYEFGDPFEKRTCLWLKGLPKLQPTNIVKPPKRTEFKSGKSIPTWYSDAWKLPKYDRAKLRSKTFPGIAKAMAQQWGDYILNNQ